MTSYEDEIGSVLRSIRKACGFSQVELSRRSGIHEDTLRRIENAFVIPKHETLVVLAEVLKIDVGMIFILANRNKSITHRLELITETILDNNPASYEKEVEKLEDLLEEQITTNIVLSNEDIKKTKLYISASRAFLNNHGDELIKSVDLLERMLFKQNASRIDLDSLKRLKTTYLDLMILILYGSILGSLNQIDKSTAIFEFCYKKGKALKLDSLIYTKMRLKLMYNLAYNYHIYDWHEKVIKITREGIALAQKNHLMYHLSQLFYRKGIAEYNLDNNEYLSSLKKSLAIFDVYEQIELKEKYIEITKDVYGIDMSLLG